MINKVIPIAVIPYTETENHKPQHQFDNTHIFKFFICLFFHSTIHFQSFSAKLMFVSRHHSYSNILVIHPYQYRLKIKPFV